MYYDWLTGLLVLSHINVLCMLCSSSQSYSILKLQVYASKTAHFIPSIYLPAIEISRNLISMHNQTLIDQLLGNESTEATSTIIVTDRLFHLGMVLEKVVFININS